MTDRPYRYPGLDRLTFKQLQDVKQQINELEDKARTVVPIALAVSLFPPAQYGVEYVAHFETEAYIDILLALGYAIKDANRDFHSDFFTRLERAMIASMPSKKLGEGGQHWPKEKTGDSVLPDQSQWANLNAFDEKMDEKEAKRRAHEEVSAYFDSCGVSLSPLVED